MDGLECSEVNISKLEFSRRIDAEYYRKSLLEFENRIILSNHTSLCEVAGFLIGPFGSAYDTSNYTTLSNYRYVRGQDVKPFILKDDEPRFIERCDFERLSKYSLKEQDIMVSVVGTLGNACLVRSKDLPAIFSCKSTVIRTKKLNPYFLIAYLNSKYGSQLLLRKERGAIQKGLNLDDLKSLIVPVFSDILQSAVQKSICNAYNMLDNSKLAYSQAEQILLDELGMADFKPSIEKVEIKNFSDSFGLSGRLDAEFYQPFYDKYENTIKKSGYELAEDICSDINYGTVPTSPYTEDGSGVPYIKGMNIKNALVDDSNLDRIVNTINLPSKYYTKRGDIIISQMGTVADCGVVTEEQENWVFASFTIRLRLKKNVEYNPYFIGLYIQLLAKPYYFYRYIAQASVRQNTDLPTVRKMIIPKLSIEKQNLIATKIQESFSLQKKSKELLERATQAVEMAIEKDEQIALDWLASQE